MSGGSPPAAPSFREAARFWITLGFVNFGGPSGQIALMHTELVDRRRWIDEDRFLHALSFCTLLPGPEAQQLAIYVGWLLHRTRGGILAGVAFVLPSFFLILGLSWVYAVHGSLDWVAGAFAGLSAGVLGMVADALLRIGTRALRTRTARALAVAAFVAIFALGVPFPAVVLFAGALGLVVERLRPGTLGTARTSDPTSGPTSGKSPGPTSGRTSGRTPGVAAHDQGDDVPAHARPSRGRAARVLATGVAVWWIPLVAVALWRGGGDTLTQEAFFFSGAAVVTFGGAYAVLAYANQAAVTRFGWLAPTDVTAGLGLAESTPGPLIMVLEFVGFLAAYRFPGDLPPLMAGVLGAVVTVWATFAPCFLWILLGAPYVERVRGNRRVTAALGAVSAAVVGVIGSLALTFGVHVLFDTVRTRSPLGAPIPVPTLASLDLFSLALAVTAFILVRRRTLNAALVTIGCGVAGIAWALLR